MTQGDDMRLICRELRRYTLKKHKNPTVQELADFVPLAHEDFQRALQLGVDEGWLSLNKDNKMVSEGDKFPETPTPPEFSQDAVKAFSFSPSQQPLWERIFLAVLTVTFVVVLSILIFRGEAFPEQVYKIVKVFMALAAAAIGAFLPGMFQVNGKRFGMRARATGAFACFLVVLWTL
jgi:hypothetical protein